LPKNIFPNDESAYLVEFAKGWNPRTVLEVGCGVGRELMLIEPHVGRVYGVDLDAGKIEGARANFPDGDFRVADGESLLSGSIFDDVSQRFEGYLSGALQGFLALTGSTTLSGSQVQIAGVTHLGYTGSSGSTPVAGLGLRVTITGSTYILPLYATQ